MRPWHLGVPLFAVALAAACIHETEKCGAAGFECRDRSCLAYSLVCDGRMDCGDGSDEDADYAFCGAGGACGADGAGGGLLCDDGTCVAPEAVCDGIADCPDGSDELYCDTLACDCACGTGTPGALVCNDPSHPSYCAGVAPEPGDACEVALTACGFSADDIASLGCTQ
jgi:hypothetical protein